MYIVQIKIMLGIMLVHIIVAECDWLETLQNVLGTSKDYLEQNYHSNVDNILGKSKGLLQNISKSIGEQRKHMETAFWRITEKTLKESGDDIENFIGEVPSAVADKVTGGIDGLLAKVNESVTWILNSIFLPIVMLIIFAVIVYLAIISGCFGFCWSQLLTALCEPIRWQFAKANGVVCGKQFIVAHNRSNANCKPASV